MDDNQHQMEPRRPSFIVQLLGDTPFRVAIRLLIMSLVVGFLMAVFQVDAVDIFRSVQRFFANIVANGFESLGVAGTYILAGAAVVIPVWVVMRLFAYTKRR